jgi:hypothetical protein
MHPFLRLFRRLLPVAALCAVALPASAQDAAPDSFALLAPLKKLISAFNHQDPKLPPDVFAARSVIVDGLAPYSWSGPAAAATWYQRQIGSTPAEQQGFREAHERLAIADPRFIRTDADRVYFVIEGTLTYSRQEIEHRTIGLWTVTETKTGDHWLIESLSWGVLRAD